jgi:hypothetical protein
MIGNRRLDALFRTRLRGVALTGADGFAVRGFQVENELARVV